MLVNAAMSLSLVWTRHLTERDGRDFDAFVERAPVGHFAQTRRWAPVACAGRPFRSSYAVVRDGAGEVVGAAHVLRAQIAGLPLPYAVIERGPVVADAAMFGPVLRRLTRAARWRGIARLAVMPYWDLRVAADAGAGAGAGEMIGATLAAQGWRSVQTAAGAHAATLRLALGGRAPGPDAIFEGGDFKKLRQEIRYAARAGAQARRGTAADLARFVTLYRGLMDQQGLHAKSDAWFNALAALGFDADGPVGLFFTEHEGETVAGALTIRHGSLVTLYLAASAPAPRKFSKMVPCLVAAVEWAQALGCDFDLGGVPMAGDTDEKRQSIAQFKRDFSKTRLDLIGQHARWLF